MIIISDTTPVHYFILISRETILPALFGEIVIPSAVALEMRHSNTPAAVRQWIDQPPAWAKIKTASPAVLQNIGGLGAGESAAIALAIEENADAVLMDDRKAVREARKNNLVVLSTLAVLELGAIGNLLDFRQALDELAQTSFRLPPDDIIKEFLNRDKTRKQAAE